MARQAVSVQMMRKSEFERRRFELMAATFLVRMGERLRERREEMGLSRSEVARRMPGKVNENQVYRWELGKHQPNPDTLEELARVLERDVAYFMATAPDKTETPSPFGDVTASVTSELAALDERLSRIEKLLEDLAQGRESRLARREQELDRFSALLDQLERDSEPAPSQPSDEKDPRRAAGGRNA